MTLPAVYDATGSYLGTLKPAHQLYAEIQALTTTQKNNILADLFAGTPMKVLIVTAQSNGRNEGAIGALHWAVVNSIAPVAAINDARLRATAMYVQDNPTYLIHPSFDSSINVPGYNGA